MQKLHHPHIVEYVGCQRVDDVLDVMEEYITGGSIAKLLATFGPFPEPLVQQYTKQICEGLAYLHDNKIIHRDIKSANCLVTGDGQVKLADFGCSKTIETVMTAGQGCPTLCGTPQYAVTPSLHSLYISLSNLSLSIPLCLSFCTTQLHGP